MAQACGRGAYERRFANRFDVRAQDSGALATAAARGSNGSRRKAVHGLSDEEKGNGARNMTDFWFILGVAATQPKLLGCIDDLKPKFERIGLALIEVQAGKINPPIVKGAAGYLDGESTTKVRSRLRDNFAKPY